MATCQKIDFFWICAAWGFKPQMTGHSLIPIFWLFLPRAAEPFWQQIIWCCLHFFISQAIAVLAIRHIIANIQTSFFILLLENSNSTLHFSLIDTTFSKGVTIRFKCHGLFDQMFTPANFGNNAEQVTFRLFWPFVNIPADILVHFSIPIRQ